ncbi:TATA element modulatory factor [Cydia pomonella]|uniref:TATA element modulatory factor n=1 Tax=Cydia pomonella TaxID=82600 RepID=UPI002ADD4635|nr:TATA element modulatory factor [Cydia pomonella]
MNWFDTSGLTSLAKTALKEAQKTLDKALDIQDESGEEEEAGASTSQMKSSPGESETTPKDNSDFFASWGLTVSAEGPQDTNEQTVVTESPSKGSQSLWGSFAGSFFEHQKNSEIDTAIVQPPKAKSMNVINDSKYGSATDLFSKSQLVMSDESEFDVKKVKDDVKTDERRNSSRSNRLSLVSSRNSSDSVEVLSQSLKTTPDSEAASVHSISHSSSVGQKLNSESVEILPDSLVSPSSIECLGFDSYSSDKNSSTSSNLSPGELSDKKSTPVDRTEKAETADSVSLVADDDEDTMSYNSISECTAPTVLDTDDKPVSPFPKRESKKLLEKEFIHLDPPLLPQKMQISENSSNDGSWSDRTLNADNDSMILDLNVGEPKKETEPEDVLMEKLSDSSSFYNVNVSGEMIRSESSAFVNVEKQQCSQSDKSDFQKGSIKERISPTSSDSKSDLVKIGSDRTSGHTSGDELETTTSSDIEIIPSPNGDNHGFRNSPAKYNFKKFDGTISPNLVDLVLGKSLATKIRGHNRELSEASVQSNTSDDSSTENDRLMRRLCEMAEILEARENRLMEVSRSNAELAESNADLKTQVESLLAKHGMHESGDISTITEDYTQRMSALEKKFQQAIREKDQLRKQLDSLKSDSSRKNSSELESSLKERDEVIAQMQEEGEKLARQQLQHSNIIKKLRAKEKDNEQVIKGLRDKIAEQTSELDRLKRSIAAKEELEVSQIEAVYRLTTANKKLEVELAETKSALDDATQRLTTTRASLEAAKRELADVDTERVELRARCGAATRAQRDADQQRAQLEALQQQLAGLRAEVVQEERRWVSREEALRRELAEARELCAALEARVGAAAGGDGAGALLAQLAALQRSALDRDQAHVNTVRGLKQQLAEAETSLTKAVERERLSRDELEELTRRLAASEGLLDDAQSRLDTVTSQCRELVARVDTLEDEVASKSRELTRIKEETSKEVAELRQQLAAAETALATAQDALETEKKRNSILQEQVSCRGDISPPHSVASDTLSSSLWASEDAGRATPPAPTALDELLARLQRREGELRAARARALQLGAERDALRDHVASLRARLDDYQSVQEQYDALLQMYGEKEEQLEELRLDLQDVTQLYKAQLDELVALKRR